MSPLEFHPRPSQFDVRIGRRLALPCALGFLLAATSAPASPFQAAPLTADGTWSLLAGETPGPAYGMAAAYDPVRGRTILFGGWNGKSLGGTFALTVGGPAPHWSEPVPGGGPPARWAADMVYDSARDRMLLIGGSFAVSLVPDLNDVWALSLSAPAAWTQVQPAAPGPTRIGQVTVYDPVRDRLLVFGGFDGGTVPSAWKNDTWQLTLSGTPTWSPVATAGTPPSPRDLSAGIYDPVRDRLVIFGGDGFDGTSSLHALSDTWALSLSGTPTWTRLTPGGVPPPARLSAAGVFDPELDRFVVMGGTDAPTEYSAGTAFDDAYALDLGATPVWSNLAPAGAGPAPRFAHSMVFDAAQDRAIVLGGVDASGVVLGDVWTLDLGGAPAWSGAGVTLGPGLRESSAGVYDEVRKQFVVFGGADEASEALVPGSSNWSLGLNDLWALPTAPGGEWIPLDLPGSPRPPLRYGHLLVRDPGRDRLVLFGGIRHGVEFNDVWAFDETARTWTQIVPAGTPPTARYSAAGYYDAAADRFVLAGGDDGSHVLNDAWELDFQPTPHWALILPDGLLPPGRMNHVLVQDAARNRAVMFGGSNGSDLHDTWALQFTSPPAWVNLNPYGQAPIASNGMASVVDPVRHRLVVYGGYGTGFPSTYGFDAYALDLTAALPGWTTLAPGGESGASPRSAMAAAYDAAGDRMVVFGGHGIRPPDVTTTHTLGDAWALTWADTPTPALLGFAGEELSAGAVRLTWFTPDGAGQRATAERSPDGASWQDLAPLVSDASGRFVLEDAVAAGGRYDYRLAYAAPGGGALQYTDGHWVTIPAGVEFGITATGANPSRGALRATVVLAAAGGDAALELFDVRGRRVLRRDLAGLAPGPHDVDLAAGNAVASGAYWLRLSQGARAATRRVALIR